MTRQRMRPSMRKSHFVTCPQCQGHGEIKSPEYVGSHAVRHTGYLLQYDQVATSIPRALTILAPHNPKAKVIDQG